MCPQESTLSSYQTAQRHIRKRAVKKESLHFNTHIEHSGLTFYFFITSVYILLVCFPSFTVCLLLFPLSVCVLVLFVRRAV
jgi:hypothetical protein